VVSGEWRVVTVEAAERAKWRSVRARTQGVGAVVHCVGRHVQRVRDPGTACGLAPLGVWVPTTGVRRL